MAAATNFGPRPALTAADLDFARGCEQLATNMDVFFGMLMATFAFVGMTAVAAQQQRPTPESTIEFRHGVHAACIPVPMAWRSPKPKLDKWQQRAAKLAEQITMPLDELLAERMHAA
jgi:hypothetical protein